MSARLGSAQLLFYPHIFTWRTGHDAINDLFLCLATPLAAQQKLLSPSDIKSSADGSTLYVACATATRIQVFDTKAEKVSAQFAIDGVREITLSNDGGRIFALCGESHGQLLEIDAATGKVLRNFPAGHTPMASILSSDGKTLFYCNQFSRADKPDVHAFDIASGKISLSGKAIREPVTMKLSKDGKYLWVANHLPLMECPY